MDNSLVKSNSQPSRWERFIHNLTFGKRRDEIRIDRMTQESEAMIQQLGTIKEFDVSTVEEFKCYLYENVYNNPSVEDKGFIIMGDVNNLYAVNKYSGKEIANEGLREIIGEMKAGLEEVNAEYVISKLGDEIYIYASGITEEQMAELKTKLNGVRASNSMLSISVGYSRVNENPEQDIRMSEVDMEKEKSAMKINELNELTGGHPDAIINHIVTKHLQKLRIDIDKIKDHQKELLFDKYRKILFGDNFDIKGMVQEALESKIEIVSPETQEAVHSDTTYTRIEQYRAELEQQFPYTPLSEDFVNKHILARLLNEDKSGKITHNQLLSVRHQEISGFHEKNGLEDIQVISIELIGKKWINDKYGHDACDEYLKQQLEEFEALLDTEGIDTHKVGLIKKGFSSYYFFVDKMNQKQFEMLKEKSLAPGPEEDKDKPRFGMSMAVSDLDVRDGRDEDAFKQALGRSLSENERVINEREIQYKIETKEMLEAYIVETLREITNHPIIQAEVKRNPEYAEQIKIEMMNTLQALSREGTESDKGNEQTKTIETEETREEDEEVK